MIVRLLFTLVLAGLIAPALPARPAVALELMMIDRKGCVYCTEWKNTLGPIYPKTDVGEFAPLRIVDINAAPPEGVKFDRPVLFTPTFILVEEGEEIGRIEGNPGEDFFWWRLESLLRETTDFEG